VSNKAVFLDRDGVINHDKAYVYKFEDFEFIEGIVDALKYLQNQGYALIIVTNQSGIGRGYYTEADYQSLTTSYRNILEKAGIEILDVLHCPHHPSANCECRKPKPGLFLQAIEKYDIDVKNSLMFGDKLTDMQAAAEAGIENLFLIAKSKKNTAIDSAYTFKIVESVYHFLSKNKASF